MLRPEAGSHQINLQISISSSHIPTEVSPDAHCQKLLQAFHIVFCLLMSHGAKGRKGHSEDKVSVISDMTESLRSISQGLPLYSPLLHAQEPPTANSDNNYGVLSDLSLIKQISLPQKAPKLCCNEQEKLQVGLGMQREEHPLVKPIAHTSGGQYQGYSPEGHFSSFYGSFLI